MLSGLCQLPLYTLRTNGRQCAHGEYNPVGLSEQDYFTVLHVVNRTKQGSMIGIGKASYFRQGGWEKRLQGVSI